jgi:hypothetical protein
VQGGHSVSVLPTDRLYNLQKYVYDLPDSQIYDGGSGRWNYVEYLSCFYSYGSEIQDEIIELSHALTRRYWNPDEEKYKQALL